MNRILICLFSFASLLLTTAATAKVAEISPKTPMQKKVIAFDLDDTLAVTKSPISPKMGDLLVGLLDRYEVCIISGGKFEQFKTQVIDRLKSNETQLSRLHIMPTSGTRYYRFNLKTKDWDLQYAEDLDAKQKELIFGVSKKLATELNIWPQEPFGEVIEDRGSQVSISLLGQLAPAEKKYQWAEKNSAKREELRVAIEKQLPGLSVRAGGTTTIDISRAGIDKAYGMNRLMERLSIGKQDILFVGDKMEVGGNDYPVKAMGVDSVAVSKWEDTALLLEGILAVSPKFVS